MKTITSAEFRNGFADLTEAVEVRRYNQILGVWTPMGVPMEEKVEKAIEPEQVKADNRGKLTKGLGKDYPFMTGHDTPPPGKETFYDPKFGASRPAPKPGKK